MVRTPFMGRVTCEARVTSVEDELRARHGDIPVSKIRSVSIDDALVDTGASTLALPTRFLRELGLTAPISKKRTRNTTGAYEVNIYGPVRLWIGDRDMVLDAMEVNDDCPVLIGQIPLEHLQYIVDMQKHKLVPSPENGGDWILDLF